MSGLKMDLGDDGAPVRSKGSLLKPFSDLTEFMTNPVLFLSSLAAQGPALQRRRLGPKHFVFVFDPTAAQEILVKRADIYVQNRTVFDRIQPVTGKKGLVQLAGEESRKGRVQGYSTVSGSALERSARIIETLAGEFVEKLKNQPEMDVSDEMTTLILKTALKIFLGLDSDEIVAQIGGKFLRLNYLCGLRMRALAPLPLAIPTYKNREIRRLQTEIRERIEREVRSGRASGSVTCAYADSEHLIDHCMTFLFAGHETTASSLAFSLLLLARDGDGPESYQERIAQGDEKTTLAVYKESLRLYPPAYMLVREALADDDLCGLAVKKSDQVVIGTHALHRSPRFFDHPDEFRPERFQEKLNHPFSFIPFGAGQKSCVGERLAYVEASIILRKICQSFRLRAVSEQIESEPLITLHPLSGQMIVLERRAP